MSSRVITFAVSAFLLLSISTSIQAQSLNRVEVAGQEIFMNGGNVAWVNFARDIGPGNTNLSRFEEIFQEVQEYGGNTMRLWLHTNGTSTPEWNGGMVVGPGQGAIDDLRDILDLAQVYNVSLMLCLWSFDMLQGAGTQTGLDQDQIARNTDLLTDEEHLDAYIDHSLIPMVDALKGHPAINSWEIFNEPEGMTSYGWAPNRVSMSDIQWFVNRTAGAIRRTDPDTPVTNGSWNIRVLSDIGSFHNYYRDDRLIAAGGDPDGILDFYTVHFYPEHFPTDQSPFHNDADHWELDKPLVVAEFWPTEVHGVAPEDLYTTLYDRGYAGALAWSWSDTNEPWQPALDNMKTIFDRYPNEVQLNISDMVHARLSAFPRRILEGDSSEVTWFTTGAETVTLNGEMVASSGSLEVTPADTTVYELIATGDNEDQVIIRDTVFVVAPDAFNWAFERPAFASSIENPSHRATNATDGSADTRWSSAYRDGEWIYVDLGASFEISKVVLNWEDAYGAEYDIDVSFDGMQWQTIHEERNGQEGIREINVEDPVEGRFVRMYGYERATEWGFSIYEFEVYGLKADRQPPQISLISPADGRRFDAGEQLILEADVEPGTGTPEHVRFFINGDQQVELVEEPYRYEWTVDETGEFEISVVFTDSDFEVHAAPVTITVQDPPETTPYDVALAEILNGAELLTDEDAFEGSFVRTDAEGRIRWNDVTVGQSGSYDIRIVYRLDGDESADMLLRMPPIVNRGVTLEGTDGYWSYKDVTDFNLTRGSNTLLLDATGRSVDIDHIAVRGEGQYITSAGLHPDRPDHYALSQNYPNPFNPSTTIRYDLPADNHVRLTVYDLLGRQVAVLVDQPMSAGRHQANFDASHLSSGLYIYRLESGNFNQTRQMLFVK